MNYPIKKVYITQKWGVNEETYKRFGFKGHNGIDFRLFDTNGNRATTCLLYAPHDGVVKERRSDPDGYGNYLKIESDTEGSILGHLKEFKVNINKIVKEGDLIGICDNTGWSTGPHLHWGYYRKPRDRSNGYGGTIDPTPYIKPSDNMINQEELDKMRFERDRNWNLYQDEIKKTKGLQVEIERLKAENSESYAQAELRKKEISTFIETLAQKLFLPAASDKTDIISGVERLLVVEDQLTAANKIIAKKDADFAKKENEWSAEINELKTTIGKMSLRLENLEQEIETGKTEKAENEWFKSIIDSIMKIFKR